MDYKPEFTDKYGHPLDYAEPYKKDAPVAFYGIIWVRNKETNKVHVLKSTRPYSTSAPARRWVSSHTDSYWFKENWEVLDTNIINTQTWDLVDKKD